MNILFITTTVCMCISAVLYGYFRGKWGNKSLIWKALATAMAGIIAAFYAVTAEETYGWFILAAVVLCMTADIVLEIDFIKGILIFGCAHICFSAAYIQLARVRISTFIAFVIIYICVLALFHKDIKNLKNLKIPAFIYMALLVFMVSMAWTVYSAGNSGQGFMLLIGAVCFLVSDCIIGFRTLRDKQSILYGAAILILYYSAVYLISASSFCQL